MDGRTEKLIRCGLGNLIGSSRFNKDLDRRGTSKRKQKALLHIERMENAINTRRLEIQKVIIFVTFSGTLPT
jgi:hypothetical protein